MANLSAAMKQITYDVLVIGGGAAGARAAYEAKKARPNLKVLMVVAGGFGTSGSTNLTASESLGINAPFNSLGDGDNPDIYYEDILATGIGLSDPALCRIIADEVGDRVNELIELGLKFDTDASGRLIQHKLSGSTKARSLSCGGATGRNIVRVLKEGIKRLGVEVLENTRAVDLARDDQGRVCGAYVLCGAEPMLIRAGAVVLATGGAGRIFERSVNPPTVEGDGWCMAYRAGARLINMEFYQIGPAVFYPRMKFIIHSHMWRLKPKLTNVLGEEFLSKYCPPGYDSEEVMELKAMSYPFSVRTAAMYFDIAIFKEVIAGRGTESGGVFFDVTHVGADTLRKRAPVTYDTIRRAGVDLAQEKMVVGMAAQAFNGGIMIDADGFTGVEGLFAAGEVTGGVHGADRPGGNNLADTQVFGYRAGRAAADYAANTQPGIIDTHLSVTMTPLTQKDEDLISEIASLYYSKLTVVKDKAGLENVLDFIDAHKGNNNFAVQNRLTLGLILATAALTREESRGTHYREDFPQTSQNWDKRIIIAPGQEGNPEVTLIR